MPEDVDDVLQILVLLQDLLHGHGRLVVVVAEDARVEDARGRGEGIDGRIDAELDDLSREVGGGVEVGEGRGWCGVGVVVGRNVDRLDGGDGALVRRGDALLELPHLGLECGLVSDGGGHAAEQRRDLGTRLCEAEDVVDEEENVLALFVAEVLGYREARESDSQARTGRLGHLAIDERSLALLEVLAVDDSGLLELEPEVVPLASSLADAGEDGNATVLLREVVDELLDDDGLADSGATEEADLPAAEIGLDEVDDLDPGLEHLEFGGQVDESWGRAVDRVASCPTGPARVCPPARR